jgi:hypothetical protein
MIPAFSQNSGFDWRKVRFTPPGSDPGVTGTLACAYCDGPLGQEPLRLFSIEREAAAFCDACAARWFGRKASENVSS